jgi:hypothetical protein
MQAPLSNYVYKVKSDWIRVNGRDYTRVSRGSTADKFNDWTTNIVLACEKMMNILLDCLYNCGYCQCLMYVL